MAIVSWDEPTRSLLVSGHSLPVGDWWLSGFKRDAVPAGVDVHEDASGAHRWIALTIEGCSHGLGLIEWSGRLVHVAITKTEPPRDRAALLAELQALAERLNGEAATCRFLAGPEPKSDDPTLTLHSLSEHGLQLNFTSAPVQSGG